MSGRCDEGESDFHIHVYEGLTERDLGIFFSDVMGSRWYGFGGDLDLTLEDLAGVVRRVSATPGIWVGSVSWLKASVFGDLTGSIPASVSRIAEIIGEDLPVVGNELIDEIMSSLSLRDETSFVLQDPYELREFLEEYRGERVFTVSW